MTERLIHFSAPITGADTEKRTITGRVAPYGEVGHTSVGPTRFEAGAFGDLDPDSVKLVVEHDDVRPIGKAVSLTADEHGVTGTFKVANTTTGNDALVEASEGLRDGLSVGALIEDGGATTDEHGVLVVTSARIAHVGLVTSPAFEAARVTRVAATSRNTERISPKTTEPHERNQMNENENETEIEAAEEAPKPKVEVVSQNPVPASVAATRNRSEFDVTAGEYLQRMVRAQRGDNESREWIEAALDQTVTTDVPGAIPTPWTTEVIGVVDASRRFINTIERRALPNAGMTFQVPTRSDTARASVGEHVEATEVTSTPSSITYTDVDVTVFSGANRVSVEVIERADPSFLNELLVQHAESYARVTDDWAMRQALAGAATATAGTTVHETIINAINESASAFRGSPDSLLLNLASWTALKKATDNDGRPLFPHLAPQNAPGSMKGDALTGEVEGLTAFVDFNYPEDATPSNGAIIYPSSALRFYESGPVQVRAMQVSSLEYEFGLYGYVGFLKKVPGAVLDVAI